MKKIALFCDKWDRTRYITPAKLLVSDVAAPGTGWAGLDPWLRQEFILSPPRPDYTEVYPISDDEKTEAWSWSVASI
jgi:hypothetical protein